MSACRVAIALSLAGIACTASVHAFEQSLSCPEPTWGTDHSYAPSAASIRVSQDSVSRYVRGRVKWHDPYYFSYFLQQSINFNGSLFPLGFEMETHFYNYDNSLTTGFGPAYILDTQCRTVNIAAGTTCGGTTATWNECDFPSCYIDTQAFSDTNAVFEYSQPNIALGSYNGRLLQANRTYIYGTRGTTGRGNRSLVKMNFQVTRPATGILFGTVSNQYTCTATQNFPSNVELLPMSARVYAPLCMWMNYKYGGTGYNFCTP